MTPLVVSDASPIIALQQIGRLDLIRALFTSVAIPPVVAREIAPSLPRPPFWLVEQALERELDLRLRRAGLDAGEREVIGLALERPTLWVALDDRPARRVAARFGVPVIGTIGVVALAKQRRFLTAVKPTLDVLIADGPFVGPSLYRDVLTSLGELPRDAPGTAPA